MRIILTVKEGGINIRLEKGKIPQTWQQRECEFVGQDWNSGTPLEEFMKRGLSGISYSVRWSTLQGLLPNIPLFSSILECLLDG